VLPVQAAQPSATSHRWGAVIGLRTQRRRVPSPEWALKSDGEAADSANVPPSSSSSSSPSSSPSAGTPLGTGAHPLLPELLQSGLLLGLSVGVVGLAFVAAHLLTALQ